MIDIHAHILPGLDDGARDLEAALQMAQAAVADGISQIIATPHVISGSFDYSRAQILAAVSSLNQELISRQIPLQILPGGEYRLEANLPARLREGTVLTLNDSHRYLLVELPATILPPYFERVIYEIQLQGVTPIIAHPERNRVIMENPQHLQTLTERGMLAQLTATSVTGDFGKEVRKSAWQLIKQGSIQFLATDAHAHDGRRSPKLSAARDAIIKQFGPDYAFSLVDDNPRRLINGQELANHPVPQTKISWTERLKNLSHHQ
jgi:protein-tyrosine phosphatase